MNAPLFYIIVTQWIADDGTQHTGSDERLVSEHATFAEAKAALGSVLIRHPHNHAEIKFNEDSERGEA